MQTFSFLTNPLNVKLKKSTHGINILPFLKQASPEALSALNFL
jgi:hypothetical protein